MCRKPLTLWCLFVVINTCCSTLFAQTPQATTKSIGPSGNAQQPVADRLLAAPAQNLLANRTVRALIIGYEGDPSIGAGAGISGRRIRNAIKAAFPATQPVQIQTTLVGIDSLNFGDRTPFSAANVQQAIQQMTVGPDDIVFCYVLTHGAFDGRHNTSNFEFGHWFQTEAIDPRTQGPEVYPRVNLMERLVAKGAKLTVLISDSCNVRRDVSSFVAAPTAPAPPALPFATLYSLLVEYEGQVDISASSQGEFSFYDPQNGGMFTNEFLGLAQNDHGYTWPTFFAKLQFESNKRFHDTFGVSFTHPQTGEVSTGLTPKMMRDSEWVRKIVAPAAAAPAAAPQPPVENAPKPAT